MTPESAHSQRSILHTHRLFLRAGLALASPFAWIFIFQRALAYSRDLTDAFFVAVLVYGLSQVVFAIATPLSAAHLRHGVKRAMIFGSLVSALAFSVLGATIAGYFSSPAAWGLVLFGILLGACRALYWIPYRSQSAGASSKRNYFFEILFAMLPAFAGITLATVYLSPLRLLFGASALMALSALPVLFLEDYGEPFRWGYRETFAKLFERRYQALALRSVLSGIESATLFLLWPLAIFLIVGGSYLVFGLVMSASLLILLACRQLYRGIFREEPPLALDVAFSISGWVLRLTAGTPLAIVFADSYSYVGTPMGAGEFLSREHAADAGSYIDEYTALQEIGMALGRISMCAFAGALLFTVPLSIALALALTVTAFVAGAAAILSRKVRLEAF